MIADKREIFKSDRYRWIYVPADGGKAADVASWSGVPRPVAEIIAKKGIESRQELEVFLNMPLSALLNPFGLMNMDKAASRLADAVERRERICIYGDYDVDGITSTAALYLFLKKLGADVVYYIPNRLEEGYGLNNDAVSDIASRGVKLLVTVDCGIGAEKEVEAAASCGLDVIITDHHQPSENIPKKAWAIINPMQRGDTYSFKSLSGVGVAFKVIMALRYVLRQRGFFKGEPPNIKSFLDIITLGTVADVVPITGENRIIVNHGLSMMSGNNIRTGIDELKNVTGMGAEHMRTSHVGFQLAPRINAVGRMGSSDKSLRLLITSDRAEARKLALELDSENRYRQAIEREIMKETFDMIDSGRLAEKRRGIVLYSKNWHPGVIGIVASRVVDRYFRPTVILTADGDAYKGSARSIPCFHLYNGLQAVSDTLLSFGGHKYAAGLKVAPDRIEELRDRFDETVKEALTDDDFIPEINIDAFLDAEDINMGLLGWLSRLEPYGAGNKEPVFAMKGVGKHSGESFVGKENAHLKCCFEKDGAVFDSIGYNMKEYKDLMAEKGPFDIAFTLTVNKWRGEENVQLCLKDIKRSGGPV